MKAEPWRKEIEAWLRFTELNFKGRAQLRRLGGALAEGGEDPFLEGGLAVGLDVLEGYAHACVGLDVEDFGFGLEVLVLVEDFDHEQRVDGEGRGSLEIATEEAEFGDPCGGGGAGRFGGSDFGVGVEGEAEAAAFWCRRRLGGHGGHEAA